MRIKLSEKYPTEREEICNKIITILNLKENLEKQNKILELKEEEKVRQSVDFTEGNTSSHRKLG
jgi:exonuclease V gamma subunit